MFQRTKEASPPVGAWLLGSGLGAGLMYLLDPDRGRQRRMLIADQVSHYRHASVRRLGKARRDFANRVSGLGAEVKQRFARAPENETLVARARSKLGRYVSHPHAITVEAARGEVTLTGPILEAEAKPLIRAIGRIPGVTCVEDRLDPHQPSENLPALAGGARRTRQPPGLLGRSWAPSLQVGAVAAGLGLVSAGFASDRRSLSALAVPVGGALLLRALLDRPLDALLGMGDLRDGFVIKKSLTIHAPIEQVFALLTAFERYPRFMSHLERVERVADSRYRWTVRAKAGIEVSFESELLEIVPEQRIVFGHVGDRRGEHMAQVRFQSDADATRIQIELRYLPRFGAIEIGLTKLLGAHPKRILDADLAILKSLLEQGKARIGGQRVTWEELAQPEASSSQAAPPDPDVPLISM